MRPESWRLVVDGEADAAHNMAVDEAILEGYDRGDADRPPTLRLYGWASPAFSLGRSQRPAEGLEIDRLVGCGFSVVRRPTGGDAVLHDCERTYAVVGTLGSPSFPNGVVGTYARIAQALVLGLESLDLPAEACDPGRRATAPGFLRAPLCFERLSGSEISVGGRKLIGSAQARRRRAFLQHGSIPIRLDGRRLAMAAGRDVNAASFTDLTTAAGRRLTTDELDRALIHGFGRAFEVELLAAPLDEAEALRAAELRAWRYDSLAWTRDARLGTREGRWGPVLPS